MRNTRYSIGVPFMITLKTFWLLFSLLEIWALVAKSAGYDAIQWWPLRWYFPASIQLSTGLFFRFVKRMIGSFHQSYLTEVSLRQAINNNVKNRYTLPSYLILAHRYESLTQIMRWAWKYFREAPLSVVIHPPDAFEFGIKNQVFQLTSKVLEDNGITSVEGLIAWINQRNLKIVFDTLHSLNVLGNFEAIWPEIQDHVTQIHIRRNWDHTHIQMLRVIAESGWHGDIVIEVPINQLATTTKTSVGPFIIWPWQLVKIYRQTLVLVKNVLEQKGSIKCEC